MNAIRDPILRPRNDGVVVHDYGPGSCFSCGGTVCATVDDDTQEETALCETCGRVFYVLVRRDDGWLMEGFAATAELDAYAVWQGYTDA